MAAGPDQTLAGVDMVVDLRKNVVPRLDVRQPKLVHPVAPDVVVDLVELQDVLVDPLRRVRDVVPVRMMNVQSLDCASISSRAA